MHVFEMVVWVVGISVAGGTVMEYFKSKSRGLPKGLAQRLERLEALEDRVATLEKILTEPKSQLKREIDELN